MSLQKSFALSVALFIFLTVVVITALAPTKMVAAQAGLRTVAQWESLFQSTWQSEYNTYNPKSLSGDTSVIYEMAYALNANYMMFKATGKTEYLDRDLHYIDNLMSTAKPASSISTSQYHDNYLTWVSKRDWTIGDEYPLSESYGWRYVTALLYAMKQNPDVYNNATYRAKYDEILAFTEKNIWEKWYTRSLNNNIYRGNMHMASHWAMIGMYLAQLTTNATKKAQYETVWKNIAYQGMPNYGGASIKGQLRPNPIDSTAYWWNWDWNQFSRPGSDESHGNAVASFMVEANCLGLAYTNDDMQKMANLVKNVIIPREPGYLDGSGSNPPWLIDGWAQLGRYDSALQAKVETNKVGQGTTLYGAGALNAYILNGGSCRGVGTSGGGGGGGGPVCGNNVCETGETPATCSQDCHSSGTPTCTDTYTNTTPIQTGYGAVYNLFSSAKEMLVKTNSCTDTTASVTLGNGDTSTYVYKQGYQWNGTQWQALSFTGSSALVSNLWYPGSANGSIPLATGNTSKYYVAYTCQQINSASGPVWKCGCQDTTCAVSAWQLQRVSKQVGN